MTQKRYVLIAAMVAGLSAPVFPVAAQTTSHFLQRLDQNKDGALTREEIEEARGKLFARLDINGDGAIDRDEVQWLTDAIRDRAITMQAYLGNQMLRLDASGDGKVSENEFRTRAALFDLADRDGNGKVSEDEILAIRSILFRP